MFGIGMHMPFKDDPVVAKQPCAGCAALREALVKLAALWDAGSAYEVEDMGNTQYASGLQQCADELRAALAPSQPDGEKP